MSEKGKMQGYYAARAPHYDAIYAKPERQADLRQIEAWLPSLFAGRSVLEVACGTGYWTRFIADRCRRMVALDAAHETIQIAQARVPPGKVEFLIGDAYDLPAQPEQLEAGFAGFWYSHIPRARITEFLHGFHALLAPGATVVFLDNRFVAGSSTPISERDAEGNTYQTRLLADGTSHRVLKNFPSQDELLSTLSSLGTAVRYHEWQYFWAVQYAVATGQ